MSDLWGVAGGLQEAQRDADAHALAGVEIQQREQSLAEAPLRMAGLQADTDLKQTEVKSAKMTLAAQEKMMQMMQGKDVNGSVDPAKQAEAMAGNFDKFAEMSVESGLFKQGEEYANTASRIRENAARISEQKVQAENKMWTNVSDLAAGVNDENSWQRAKQVFQMIHPDFANMPAVQKLLGMPYSPQLMQVLQDSAVSAKDRAEIQAKKATINKDNAQAREAEARVPLVRAQTKLTEDRDTALTKVGAKNLIPKAGDTQAITDLAHEDFPDADTAELRAIARPVAEEAMEYISEGMPRSQAFQKAYAENKAKGTFSGLKLGRPRNSEKNPVALPKAKTELKPNTWYKSPDGTVQYMSQRRYDELMGKEPSGDDE